MYVPIKSQQNNLFDRIFVISLILMISLWFGTAYMLGKNYRVIPASVENDFKPLRTQFVIPPPPAVRKAEKKPEEPRIVKKAEEPVDLTSKPELAQKQEEIQKETKASPAPVRKVYGLRRVYSRGLGAGGNLADAVIGKLGNTLNTEVDTFTATQDEIKGRVVSTTTVTSAPRFKKTVKPSYTPEMLENRVEGTVKLKVLVDIDGKVKKATVMSDIGFNSAKQALLATQQMEFVPALRDNEPVAVWIIIPIRFVMIS